MPLPFVRLDAISCPGCALPILLKARPLTPQTIPCPNCHGKVEVHVIAASADGRKACIRWRRPSDATWQERQVDR